MPKWLLFIIATLLVLLFAAVVPAEPPPGQQPPSFEISGDVGDAMARQAEAVKEQFEERARSLFQRKPLGWDIETIEFLYAWALALPLKIPDLMAHIYEQSRLLGFVGSMLVLVFLVAVFYSVFGHRRVMALAETRVTPYEEKIPQTVFPFLLSALRVVIAASFPLLLLLAFALLNEMIDYDATWFQLIGSLLTLWAIGALAMGLLRELLTGNLFAVTDRHGEEIYRLARLALLYALVGIATYWGAAAFIVRSDVLALLHSAVSFSIIIVLFLLHLKKTALLSLLPQLPYGSYQRALQWLRKYYFPFIFFALGVALVWLIGYRNLGRTVLVKTWSSGLAYLVIMVLYHILTGRLTKWHRTTKVDDEPAQFLYRSFKRVLMYAMVLATLLIVLNLFGLMQPLEQLMSVTAFSIGEKAVTLWVIIEAILLLLGIIFASRLLQAYLDFKVYPSMGIDPGLGYALNTFLNYISLGLGLVISLKVVGLDLRFLLVFAGAIGIGIGLGLQNMAANIISGFSLIFGGKVRKGDWIEVSGTLGQVVDIFMQTTKVRDRDNIEYLIPNAEFVSGTIINYSLASPMIRIDMPIGASYAADPRQVEQIMLEAANNEPDVSDYKPPSVRFIEYGDNSINFELLFWIDVRATPRRRVRSNLYFAIFEAFKEAGIEIPFPQRDLHVRTMASPAT
jgi:small-conductance mechanosensitive channel